MLTITALQLKAMRDILDADKDDEDSSSCTPEESTTPEPIAELLLGGSPSASLDDLHPEPAQVVRLWQTYLERVNPLTKVIHVPTLQPFVIEAAGASRGIPLNIEALLFAIFVMATISLDEDECVRLLGFEREEAIKRFSAGVRIALTKVGFLTSYDLVTLQALVIYQVCRRQPATSVVAHDSHRLG